MIADTIPKMFHILKSRYVEQYGETKASQISVSDVYIILYPRYVRVFKAVHSDDV